MIFLAPLYMPFHDVVKIDINIMFNKNPMNGHLEQFLLHKMSSTLGILLPKLFLLCAEICRVNVQKLKMQVTMGRKDSQGSRHLSCTYLISPSSILSKALGFYAEPAEFYKPPHTHTYLIWSLKPWQEWCLSFESGINPEPSQVWPQNQNSKIPKQNQTKSMSFPNHTGQWLDRLSYLLPP